MEKGWFFGAQKGLTFALLKGFANSKKISAVIKLQDPNKKSAQTKLSRFFVRNVLRANILMELAAVLIDTYRLADSSMGTHRQ